MGSCFSSSSPKYIEEAVKTSKIVFTDGSLREFSIPVKASTVLLDYDHNNYGSNTFFLCNSDSLNYDEYIRVLRGDEFVLPGKMYFVLPIEMLRKPVTGSDMAALAVKASSALSKNVLVKSESRKGNNRVMPVVEDDSRMINEKVNVVGGASFRLQDANKMKKRVRGMGKIELSAISE